MDVNYYSMRDYFVCVAMCDLYSFSFLDILNLTFCNNNELLYVPVTGYKDDSPWLTLEARTLTSYIILDCLLKFRLILRYIAYVYIF